MKELNNINNSARAKKVVKVKVVPTEIYSRVVGYYRPVQDWNKGKVEEFSQRKTINPGTLN